MLIHKVKVVEIGLDAQGKPQVLITCPPSALPSAGQYFQAYAPGDAHQVLPISIFPSEIRDDGFWSAPPAPESWLPGTELNLLGPLGKGFRMRESVRRLTLIALDESPARLLPLIFQALTQDIDIILFTDHLSVPLPASVEVSPLSTLPEALTWADFLALDLKPSGLSSLRTLLRLSPEQRSSLPAQALIYTPMPCAGVADCSVCAVPGRRGWKLACKDGPVFDLKELDW